MVVGVRDVVDAAVAVVVEMVVSNDTIEALVVVGVVVVVWFLLGILHFLASLVWGVVEVAGLVALVLVVGWLLFRNRGD